MVRSPDREGTCQDKNVGKKNGPQEVKKRIEIPDRNPAARRKRQRKTR